GDGDLQVCFLHSAVEFFKLADARLRVIRYNPQTVPFFWCGLDAVRIRESATLAESIEAAQHGVAAAKNEHSIDALGRELECRLNEIVPVAVDHSVGAQPLRHRRSISAGGHRQHLCAALLGKL